MIVAEPRMRTPRPCSQTLVTATAPSCLGACSVSLRYSAGCLLQGTITSRTRRLPLYSIFVSGCPDARSSFRELATKRHDGIAEQHLAMHSGQGASVDHYVIDRVGALLLRPVASSQVKNLALRDACFKQAFFTNAAFTIYTSTSRIVNTAPRCPDELVQIPHLATVHSSTVDSVHTPTYRLYHSPASPPYQLGPTRTA